MSIYDLYAFKKNQAIIFAGFYWIYSALSSLFKQINFFNVSFQMALDSKTIKEEILDKDIYEANAIRAKGEQ